MPRSGDPDEERFSLADSVEPIDADERPGSQQGLSSSACVGCRARCGGGVEKVRAKKNLGARRLLRAHFDTHSARKSVVHSAVRSP